MKHIDRVEKALNLRQPTVFPVKAKPTAAQAKQDFYLDFISSKMKDKAWLNKDVMQKLHTIPMPDKDVGSYQAPEINSIHQCDVL